MKGEQGDDDVDKFSTVAIRGDLHSLSHNKGALKSSSSTTVDTPKETHHIYAELHEKQRAGKKVDPMYNDDQVAAPANGINNLLCNAKVCIDFYYHTSFSCRSFL